MINKQIEKISNDFLEEAKSSPRLMTDMASMEKYMAESYGDRILIELLQNSDDAQSTKVKLIIDNGFVIFANNGRPFDENDVVAICRSGASSKTNGVHIGHRGVGFKSTTSLSSKIIIASNETFFTFSKSHCAEVLGVNENEVPTVRVPFIIDSNEISNEIKKSINLLSSEGYSTAFVFLEAKTEMMQREIDAFNKSCLLFINHIQEFSINANKNIELKILRQKTEIGENVEIIYGRDKQTWWIPKDDFRYFAFKTNGDEICECSADEAVFHNFMPTLEKSPFKFKINATFPTDPSRKNITLDDNAKELLSLLADKLFVLINNCCLNKVEFKEILKLFIARVAYNQTAIYLYNALTTKLKSGLKLQLNNGARIIAGKYKLIDDTFDYSEKAVIRKLSQELNVESCINSTVAFEEFISKLSDVKVDDGIYKQCLESESFVCGIAPILYNKILSFVVKKNRAISIVKKTPVDFSSVLIKDENRVGLLVDAEAKSSSIQTLKSTISSDELKWLVDTAGLDRKIATSSARVEVSSISTGTFISKWRSAEQQVVEIEIMSGNKAEYVGNQNLGYDVLSKTPNGDVRYIEVKLLSSDKGEFTLTNNEYSSAHQYGDKYFLCLLVQKESEIKVTYIQNPLGTLQLDKRVKQWEWYCDNFTGEVKIYKYR